MYCPLLHGNIGQLLGAIVQLLSNIAQSLGNIAQSLGIIWQSLVNIGLSLDTIMNLLSNIVQSFGYNTYFLFSNHQMNMSHRLSKLSQVKGKVEQEYKTALSQAHTHNTQVLSL